MNNRQYAFPRGKIKGKATVVPPPAADQALESMPLEHQVLVWRRRAITAERAKDFEAEGRRAFDAGTPRDDNPYRHAAMRWLTGWNDAQAREQD